MTVSMQTTKRTYQANGVTTQWDVDFPLLAAGDVRVYLTSPEGIETALTDGYTVDLPTHTLTYPTAESGLAPLSEGWSLTVLRRTPMTQEIDLIRQGELDAEVLEEGYDKLTLLVQELNEKVERSVKYPASSLDPDLETESFLSKINAQRQQAQDAASQAELSAQQAQTSAGAAQAAQVQTNAFLQQAQSAQTAAETAKTAAQAAQSAAESAKTAAQTAQTQAETSSAAASASAALAQNWAVKTDGVVSGGEYSAKYHAQQAASSASAASTAKTAAQTAQTAAETAKTQAASSASAASGSATAASNSSAAASASAVLAQNWAVKTDGAVSGGEYSAKYHAQQAASSASTAGTAKTAAQTAQSAAESAKTAAETAKTQASSSASAAAGSATSASTSAALAQNWAVKTDGAVSGGEYSAKYHAQQAASSASAAGTAKTAAQTAQSAAESAKTQASSSASAAASSAAAASQSAQTCQELVASVGDPASKDLSNVTSISSSSAVQTALTGKAATDLSNGTKATQANINTIMPDAMDYVVDSYSDEEGNWYRVYKSGWVEQGGKSVASFISGSTEVEQVTFLKPFADTNYTVMVTKDTDAIGNSYGIAVKITSAAGCILKNCGALPGKIFWYACGQGAE